MLLCDARAILSLPMHSLMSSDKVLTISKVIENAVG